MRTTYNNKEKKMRQVGKQIRVKVLRRHITEGMRGMCSLNKCIVAQALNEKFPRRAVTVGIYGAHIGGDSYMISSKGATLINRALAGKIVKPTTITLTKC